MSDFNDGIEKLKPCPFCGGAAWSEDHPQHGARIYCNCDECLGPSTTALTMQDAIVQWNTRPTPDRSEARERIAAEFAEKFPAVLAQYSQFKIVDWFLATGLVQDEASIRADEREKCAKVAEQEAARWHDGSSARVAAANIRAGSGDGATIAAGHVSIPNDILMQARCPSDARQTIGECSNCGCSIGLFVKREGAK